MENAPFFTITLLVLGTVFMIFGMKYFAKGRAANAALKRDGNFAQFTETQAQNQSAIAETLENLRAEMADLKQRTQSIETMLKEVG